MDRPRRLPLSWRRLRARLLVRVFFLRLFFRVRARRRRAKTSPDSLTGQRPECSALGMSIPRPAISREDALERIERLRQELAWLVQKYETQHATQAASDVSSMVPLSYGTRVRQRSTGWLGAVLRWHHDHSKWLVRFDEVGGRFVGHEDLVEVGHEDLVEEEQRRPRGEPHPGQAQHAANRAMRLQELRVHHGGGPDQTSPLAFFGLGLVSVSAMGRSCPGWLDFWERSPSVAQDVPRPPGEARWRGEAVPGESGAYAAADPGRKPLPSGSSSSHERPLTQRYSAYRREYERDPRDFVFLHQWILELRDHDITVSDPEVYMNGGTGYVQVQFQATWSDRGDCIPVSCHATLGRVKLRGPIVESVLQKILVKIRSRNVPGPWTFRAIAVADKDRFWRIMAKVPVMVPLHTYLMGCWQRLGTGLRGEPQFRDSGLAVAQYLFQDGIDGGRESCFHLDLRRDAFTEVPMP